MVFTAPHFLAEASSRIHHVHRQQFVRHGEIEARKPHRLRAGNGGAEIVRVHLAGHIAPVQAQRGERGVVHGRRGGMSDGRAKHRAQARRGD